MKNIENVKITINKNKKKNFERNPEIEKLLKEEKNKKQEKTEK